MGPLLLSNVTNFSVTECNFNTQGEWVFPRVALMFCKTILSPNKHCMWRTAVTAVKTSVLLCWLRTGHETLGNLRLSTRHHFIFQVSLYCFFTFICSHLKLYFANPVSKDKLVQLKFLQFLIVNLSKEGWIKGNWCDVQFDVSKCLGSIYKPGAGWLRIFIHHLDLINPQQKTCLHFGQSQSNSKPISSVNTKRTGCGLILMNTVWQRASKPLLFKKRGSVQVK